MIICTSTIATKRNYVRNLQLHMHWLSGLTRARQLAAITEWHGHYPYGHNLCPNRYSDYLAQCRAYKFAPLDQETWAYWRSTKGRSI